MVCWYVGLPSAPGEGSSRFSSAPPCFLGTCPSQILQLVHASTLRLSPTQCLSQLRPWWEGSLKLRGVPPGASLSSVCVFCFGFFCLFVFLGLHLRHMAVPRLGVELELQLPAYITATATQGPSCICDLHHSSRQHWILNPLSKAKDQTHVLMDSSRVCNSLSHQGNSFPFF